MPILNNVTLGGLPVYDPPSGSGSRPKSTNTFAMYTGASRYGKGRFLMTLNDYNTLSAAAAKAQPVGTAMLVMSSGPDATANKVSLQVVVAAAIPYTTSVNTSDPAGGQMVEVIVFDVRSLLRSIANLDLSTFNVQQDGFTYAGVGQPNFYANTINPSGGGVEWSWNDVVTVMELPISDTSNLPTGIWNPRNLIYDGCTVAKVIDDIAAKLYLVVGFDWTKENQLSLVPPGDGSTANEIIYQDANNALIAGGDWQRNASRFPNKIQVNFKVFNQDDPTNPYPANNRIYSVTYNNPDTSAANYTQQITVGDFVAIFSGGAISNTTELTTVANDIGARALAYFTVDISEKEYAGIWPFIPDGSIRAIEWTSNHNGATTKIRIGDERDFNFVLESRRAIDSISNQLIVGLGSANAANSPSGSRYFWGQPGMTVLVKFGSPTANAGEYNGNIMTGQATGMPPSSMNVGATCLIENYADSALTVWPVASGTYAPGLIIGSNSGTPVVAMFITPMKDCGT